MKEREACIQCYKENMQVSQSLSSTTRALLMHRQTLQRCMNWPGHQDVKWLCRTP